MKVAVRTLRTALANGFANRRSFALQVAFMAINDIVWVVFWGLFFHRVGVANGWSYDDVLVMFSLFATVAGVSLGLFANCRRIGQLIADGDLDEALVLPLPTLSHLLTRRIEPTNLGDLGFGLLLFAIAGHPAPIRVLLFGLAVLTGTVVLSGFLVFFGSLTFFIGGRGEHSEAAFNAILLLAAYPLDFFGGPVKLVLFTVIPAAFITGVPVAVIRHFDLGGAVSMVGAAFVVALLAWAAFDLGLRRYSSGSVWRRSA